MTETQKEYYSIRSTIPKSLEQILSSVKNFQGEYEYEKDYLALYNTLENTNPFSVLVFYEQPSSKMSISKQKKLNPNIPERMLFQFASYVQFYFTPELEERHLGTYMGSGYRSTQSTYALALALLSETKNIPTHILIFDNQYTFNHVLSSEKLIVQPHEVGETVERGVANKLLEHTIKAYSLRNNERIESIYIEKPIT